MGCVMGLRLIAALCAILTGSASAGEAPPGPVAGGGGLTIERPWVRAVPPGVTVSAAYLGIANSGPAADRLTGARSDVAARIEIHTHTMEDGIVRMREAADLPIPAHASTVLAPSATHLMLTGLVRPLHAGEHVKIVLIFEKAGEIEVEAAVSPAGPHPAGE